MCLPCSSRHPRHPAKALMTMPSCVTLIQFSECTENGKHNTQNHRYLFSLKRAKDLRGWMESPPAFLLLPPVSCCPFLDFKDSLFLAPHVSLSTPLNPPPCGLINFSGFTFLADDSETSLQEAVVGCSRLRQQTEKSETRAYSHRLCGQQSLNQIFQLQDSSNKLY